MTNPIARLISIAGHPAILMPLAAVIASASAGVPNILFLSVIIAVFFAILFSFIARSRPALDSGSMSMHLINPSAEN